MRKHERRCALRLTDLFGGPVRLAVRSKVSDWQQLLIVAQVRAWIKVCIQDELQPAVIERLSDTRGSVGHGRQSEGYVREFC